MKQLITRVPDEVLDACKRRAKAEGVSMNAFVNRLLAQAAEEDERSAALERRIAAAGLTVRVTPSMQPPGLDEALELTRGAGSALSEALEWSRGDR
jgi:antitoxin FitA